MNAIDLQHQITCFLTKTDNWILMDGRKDLKILNNFLKGTITEYLWEKVKLLKV